MGWINPTGHNDPGDVWSEETSAYDGTDENPDLDTSAKYSTSGGETRLYLTHNPLGNCDKVRVYGSRWFHNEDLDIPIFTLEVTNDNWASYESLALIEPCAGGEWVEFNVSSKNVNLHAARLKGGGDVDIRIYGFQFHEIARRVLLVSSE